MALIQFQNNTSPYLNADNINNNFNYLDEKIDKNKLEDYSTDEVIIGKWINNKPIYRKVIYIDSFPNTSTLDYPIGISNIEYAIKIYGFAATIVGDSLMINAGRPDIVGNVISAHLINGTNLRIITGADRTEYSGYIIIEYTKTTD